MVSIKELNQECIHRANYNSMSGKRGDGHLHDYTIYCNRIMEWPISDEKKQKLLDKLYEKFNRLIQLDAQHVSVLVAGASNYNAKKLDKGDKILAISSEIVEWMKQLERELQYGINARTDDKVKSVVEMVMFADSQYPGSNPTSYLIELATLDPKKFIFFYEKLFPKYKWRKNSTIAKLYALATEGKLKVPEIIEIYSNADYTAYEYKDRVFIKFMLKPQRQLIVALKSRGYWWNSHENAWSTYANKADHEWIKTISERYSKYI